VRTWAPKGHTPIIQFHFNWTHISVIAGLTRTSCMFRLHEGSIKKEQQVEFLEALRAHLKRPLLIIWDGLKARRSKLVREYLNSTEGEVRMAILPPYSPDLNPVEFLWTWLMRHALANFCPADLDELNVTARAKLKSAQRRRHRGRIGERFDAIATGVAPKGTFVRITAPMVEGRMLRGFEGLDVGDAVSVKLLGVDIDQRFIDFESVQRWCNRCRHWLHPHRPCLGCPPRRPGTATPSHLAG
jgi:transposase